MIPYNFNNLANQSPTVNRVKFKKSPLQKKAIYNCGEKITFKLDGRQVNTQLDQKFGLHLRGRISIASPTDTALSKFELVLDKAGVSSCIKTLYQNMAGYSVVTQNYNLLACIMKDLETHPLYAGNDGLLLEGMTQKANGITLEYELDADSDLINPEKTYYDFCIPINFNALSNSKSNIPLVSQTSIDLDLILEDAWAVGAYKLVIGGGAPVENVVIDNDNIVTFSDITLEGYNVVFSENVYRSIENLYGGVHRLPSTQWFHAQSIITTGSSGFSELIPISVSSMKRILVTHRDATKVKSNASTVASGTHTDTLSLGHHVNPIKEWQFSIDGQAFPSQPVRGWQDSFYELMKADDKWGVITNSCSLTCQSGTNGTFDMSRIPFNLSMNSTGSPVDGADYDVGSYKTGYNFENMNHGVSAKMMDGYSTKDSDMYYTVTLTEPLPNDLIVDYFVQADVEYVLNMSRQGSKTFEYNS